MHLSVITVSYNVKDHLRECIRSVCRAAEGMSWEYLIVDNASSDGSADMIANEFSALQLIRNNENRGFGAANNQALQQARGEYILLLNPDMRVQQDTLRRMYAFMKQHPDIGIASCRLVDENGAMLREVRRFPDVWSQFLVLTKLDKLFPGSLKRYHYAQLDLEKQQDVDQVRGSFFMISHACMQQVGLFDETFFVWFEEVDYCKRAHELGWRVVYTPVAQAVDYKGQSFKRVSRIKKRWWYLKSLLYFFRKHGW